MSKRDDFSEAVKRSVSQRAGNRCSNPRCRAPTSGPHTEDDKSINVGVSAHITAAAPGGPRYDAALNAAHRSSALNAIWLCQTCAKLIDSDVLQFSTEILLVWKSEAEQRARERLGKSETDPGTTLSRKRIGDAPERDSSPPTSTPSTGLRERLMHPRVRDSFVGRADELQKLKNTLLPSDHSALAVVTIQGMAGVGKSYLADRFAYLYKESFPGGYYPLALDPHDAPSDEVLGARLSTLVGQRNWGDPSAWADLQARLGSPRSLVHIENVDSPEAAASAIAFARRMSGCALVLSGRSRHFGRSPEFAKIELYPFDEPTAVSQLELTLGTGNIDERRRLARSLGNLPLALHLASGHIADGHSVEVFLSLLRSRGLDIAPAGMDDPLLLSDHRRAVLATTFDLSLELLRKRLHKQADVALAGLVALGHAPSVGVGRSVGAAIAGLDEVLFESLMVEAVRLSVADRTADARWIIHPLLAELLRGRSSSGDWLERAAGWIIERMSDRSLWKLIHEEGAVLELCLRRFSAQDTLLADKASTFSTFVNAGTWYALTNGPFYAWSSVFQKWLAEAPLSERSNILWILARLAKDSGKNEDCREWLERKLDFDKSNGDEIGCALACGMKAQIKVDSGDLLGGLRMLEEDVVPVYERLGEEAQGAIARAKIAAIHMSLGHTEAALGIYDSLLTVFRRLGDEDAWCKVRGHMADSYKREGKVDDALNIYEGDMLPVHLRLGDFHAAAITEGRIADILVLRGQYKDALVKYMEGQRIFGEIGDAYHEAVRRFDVGDVYRFMGKFEEALAVFEGLRSTFDHLGHSRVTATVYGRIAVLLQEMGRFREALRVHEAEEIPALVKLGDVVGLNFARGNMANILFRMGKLGRARSIFEDDVLPGFESRRDYVNATHAKVLYARVLLADGETKRATTVLEECVGFYSQIGSVDERDRAIRLLKHARQVRPSLSGERTPPRGSLKRRRRRKK